MLSKEEKKEMLQDASSRQRKKDFQLSRNYKIADIPFDDYVSFLNGIQKIFKPFKIVRKVTITKFNKL